MWRCCALALRSDGISDSTHRSCQVPRCLGVRRSNLGQHRWSGWCCPEEHDQGCRVGRCWCCVHLSAKSWCRCSECYSWPAWCWATSWSYQRARWRPKFHRGSSGAMNRPSGSPIVGHVYPFQTWSCQSCFWANLSTSKSCLDLAFLGTVPHRFWGGFIHCSRTNQGGYFYPCS